MTEKKGTNAQKKPVRVKFASTYSMVTAERILANYGVSLSQAGLRSQINQPNTYYHRFMYLPAKSITASMLEGQCRDLQAFSQQKLISYIFSGEPAKGEAESGFELREQIEEERLKLVRRGEELDVWIADTEKQRKDLAQGLALKVAAFKETINGVVEDTCQLLAGASCVMPDDFKPNLSEHLSEFSVAIRIHPEIASSLKMSSDAGMVERAIVYLLVKKPGEGAIDDKLLKGLRDSFMALDKRLLAQFEDLGGFNSSEEQVYLQQVDRINALIQAFDAHSVLVSKMLFGYYHRYGSDNENKVSRDDVLTHGVDDLVSDSYQALHKS